MASRRGDVPAGGLSELFAGCAFLVSDSELHATTMEAIAMIPRAILRMYPSFDAFDASGRPEQSLIHSGGSQHGAAQVRAKEDDRGPRRITISPPDA